MKTIGLIGGMSWESSAEYYRIINEEVKSKLGGLHSARCLLYSVDFSEIEAFQANGEWDKAGELLGNAAVIKPSSREYYKDVIKSLVENGAEGIILGCTEIGLLVKQEDAAVPLFDTTHIHAMEAVNKALS